MKRVTNKGFEPIGVAALKVLERLVTEPENQKQNERRKQSARKGDSKEREESASERVTADLFHVNPF